jgi:hypothetical protein
MSTPRYAIVLSASTAEQREAVQAIIKENASRGWWHRFPNMWLVGGRSASQWRDLVRPAMRPGIGAVLVLKIDTDDPNTWSFFGPRSKETTKWLHEHL